MPAASEARSRRRRWRKTSRSVISLLAMFAIFIQSVTLAFSVVVGGKGSVGRQGRPHRPVRGGAPEPARRPAAHGAETMPRTDLPRSTAPATIDSATARAFANMGARPPAARKPVTGHASATRAARIAPLARILNHPLDPCLETTTNRWKFYTATRPRRGTSGARATARRTVGVRSTGRRAPSDILLFPHSPLALADVLSHPAGRLDLLPVPPASSAAASDLARENALAQEAGARAPVVSLQQRRRRRHPRERVNLLTRHGEEELLERCRELLVENALVKRPGQRQLFLAAGFLTWPDSAEPSVRRRAPLLLYPVLLARVADERRYELRLDGSHPLGKREPDRGDPRPPTASPCPRRTRTRRWSITWRRSRACCPAATRSRSTSTSRSATPTCRSAAARTTACVCTALPDTFDRALAVEIVDGLALEELLAVMHLLPDYGRGEAPVPRGRAERRPGGRGPATDDIARLREYAARLAAEGSRRHRVPPSRRPAGESRALARDGARGGSPPAAS